MLGTVPRHSIRYHLLSSTFSLSSARRFPNGLTCRQAHQNKIQILCFRGALVLHKHNTSNKEGNGASFFVAQWHGLSAPRQLTCTFENLRLCEDAERADASAWEQTIIVTTATHIANYMNNCRWNNKHSSCLLHRACGNLRPPNMKWFTFLFHKREP